MDQGRRLSQWDLDILQRRHAELERLIEAMQWARAEREEEERERLWRRITAGRPLPPLRQRKWRSAPRSRSVRASRQAIVRAPVMPSRAPKRRWDAAPSTNTRWASDRDGSSVRFAWRRASIAGSGTAHAAAAALAHTRRLGRPTNGTGAVAFYARTTAVSRNGGAASDGTGAASADRLAAKVDYYTRGGGAAVDGPAPVKDTAGVDAKLAYFERAGAPVADIEDGDVLAIVTNMGADRAMRRRVARAIEKAERSSSEGGLNRTRAASAELATTQVYELPHELPLPRLTRLIEGLVAPIAAEGVFYLAVIHRPPVEGDQRNIHLHLLWTHRPGRLRGDGEVSFAPRKTRALRGPAFLKAMRHRFTELANAALAEIGAEKRHFAGSYDAEGIGHLKGGRHRGPAATALDRAQLAAGLPARDQTHQEAAAEERRRAVLGERTAVLDAVARLATATLDAQAEALAAEAAALDRRIAITRSLRRARRAIGHGIAFLPGEGGVEAIALSPEAAGEARAVTDELRQVQEIAPSALAAWLGTHQGELRRSWDGRAAALLALFGERHGGAVRRDGDGTLRVGLAQGRRWSKPASWVADVLRKHHGTALGQLVGARTSPEPSATPFEAAKSLQRRSLPPSPPDSSLEPELAALHALLGGRRAVTRHARQEFPGALRIDERLTAEMEDAMREALASVANRALRQLAIDTEYACSFCSDRWERTGYESALTVIRHLADDRGLDLATGIHDPRRAADPALAYAHIDGAPRPAGWTPIL